MITGFIKAFENKFSIISESEDINKCFEKRNNLVCPDIIIICDSLLTDEETMILKYNMCKLNKEIRLMLLTNSIDRNYLNYLLLNGVKGLINEKATGEKILEAIDIVINEGVYIDNYIFNKLNNSTFHLLSLQEHCYTVLSAREKEILDLIARGLKNKEISEKLFISKGTVDVHKYNILKKLNLKSTAELTVFASSIKHL